MILYFLSTCLLLLLGSRPLGAAEDEALLLSVKSILNDHIVTGKDLTILYRIYNIGSSPATAISLQDDYPEDIFKSVHGLHSVRWERIAPGTNVSHTVIVSPISDGTYNFTAAQITYTASESGRQQVAFSSAPGQRFMITSRDFDRHYSPHVFDWTVFGLLAAPVILVPFTIWFLSYHHYTKKEKKA